MKKILLLLQFFLFFVSTILAQKRKNSLSVNGETSSILPFENENGFGFSLKWFYGVSNSGYLALSAGVSVFHPENSIETTDATTRLIPFLLGYKQNIHKFFIEPQIGVGELGGKVRLGTQGSDYARPSVAALYAGLNTGFDLKRFSAGLCFKTAHGIENSDAGIWHDKNFHATTIWIGYYLFQKR